MPGIHPQSMFMHPALQPYREAALATAVGREVLAKLDQLPVTVHVGRPPGGARASYNVRTNEILVSKETLAASPEDTLAVLLHEGTHRIQRGTSSDFQRWEAQLRRHQTMAGVRDALTGIGKGGSMRSRFDHAVRAAALRDETEAFLVGYRYMRESGAQLDTFYTKVMLLERDLGRKLEPDDLLPFVLDYSSIAPYAETARKAAAGARESVVGTIALGTMVTAAGGTGAGFGIHHLLTRD